MATPAANPKTVRFGLYELDLDARELRKSGVRIKLQDQPFLILTLLLERPGAIVTREELQKKLWSGDTFVDFDLSLNSAVKKLRQALHDDSENPRFIETLYRRGYRFIAPVNGASDASGLTTESSTPAPPLEVVPIRPTPSPKPAFARRLLLYWAIPVLLVLTMVGYRLTPMPPPRVLGFTQITHDGLYKGDMFTDGQRLYFSEIEGDHFVVSQVSAAGGETSQLTAPFQNVFARGISPDGSSLLIGAFQGTDKFSGSWFLPLPSGPPHRVGDVVGDSIAWAPERSGIVTSRGKDIFVAANLDSEPRKIATAENLVSGIQFSPDGRRLRFQVIDPRNGSSSLWEMQRDGKDLRPLLPGWNSDPRECCGIWTPDGRYFLFESVREGRNNIWVLPEESSRIGGRPKPVQLTNGPLNFQSPLVSKDGKRIFAIGSQPRGELLRYDGKSGFAPFLNGGSISDLAFSADGKWVAYVTIPERELWRSRVDGSERLQLTSTALRAGLPQWSPDGKQILFMGANLKTDWLAYLVSSDGTGLRELIPGADAGYDPGWSPDGNSVVLTLNQGGNGPSLQGDRPGIAIFDFETKKVSPLPDAKELFSPRWSPDGRYIAAITNDSLKLVLFDRTSQQWQDLVSLPMGFPSWSHDGQFIYFDTTITDDAAFFRIRISDRKVERLTSLKGMRRFWGVFGQWTGLTPDDSPLLVRDTSSQEIYALDWQAP